VTGTRFALCTGRLRTPDAILLRIISGLTAKVRAAHGGCRVSTNVGEYQSTGHLHWYIHARRRIRDEAGDEIE